MCDKTSFRSRSCRSCHQVDKLMKAAWAEFAEMDAAAQEPYIKMADDDKVLRQTCSESYSRRLSMRTSAGKHPETFAAFISVIRLPWG